MGQYFEWLVARGSFQVLVPGILSFNVDACDTAGLATVVVDTSMVGVLMLMLAIDTPTVFDVAADRLVFVEAEPLLMLSSEAAAAVCCKCSSAAAAAFDCCNVS